ncbi:uncharacterized protein Dana_GF12224, isoform A [Drosophila ananassae]|uniref:Uncharacterized protein, isoform A n=1 Tax=Drosophila ananassae TaxID=7217 RepID=B3MI84_DROAN|nr:protein anachronism isoform X1 [Drosophila ananassae]EDV35929.1 uncharacterized protein Dana_GF12224, isoform A [Drosophila ananassae]
MANVGREKCGRSRIREMILVMFLVLLTAEESQASPFNPSFMEGVQSEVVNPFNRTILNRFNLTEEQIQRIQNRSNPNMRDEASQSSNQLYLQQVATQRLNEIIKRVQKAITNDPNSSTTKEKAGFPICNAETTIPGDWQLGTNVTLKFANSVFVHNDDRLTSAVLRLYKTHPGHNPGQVPVPTEPTERTSSQCPDHPQAGPQIRVTVSIVHQQKKNRKLERKKRTCNTTMLSSAMTGWVEIDVKCALAYWEQQMRQEEQQQQRHSQQQQQLAASVVGMLMIEVHDDEENPLRPGLYFAPPTCDQAEIAVPWSAYRTESLKSDLESWTVPRNPRLDVFFNTNPSFNNGVKTIYISPKIKSYVGMESTTSGSPAIDNQLDGAGEKESQEREHRRHHLSESNSGSDSESSQVETGIGAEELFSSASNSEQMEPISNHHRHRSGQHHHHHHHHHHPHQLHHYQRHHHKHHKMTHKPE